ncbi:Chaperone protein DnaK [Symmachiella macrocystis]|uniref:Chaperone protein DnaK n=1 Tax=Symmachiella macrocystis TaxID=2527985 RepID=A0A5C6BQ51_9PLAN|nr:Hsp70 family protein [Symmachiella macrocystis]TWU14360.1 Chaperone protein DnaK [Symmachiella macrocystis]
MTTEFAVGIDLGTTNSVLAYSSLDSEDAEIQLLPIPQLVAAGTVDVKKALPSFLYIPTDTENAGKAFALPWEDHPVVTTGELAHKQAADLPARTVVSAKSWLCHNRVDRHEPILPWGAGEDIPKVSPVSAAEQYLAHLVAAWDTAHPDAPLAEQHVVLTVPASFDASARDLTREAALAAGLPEEFVLLEEPQAALYAYLAAAGDAWRKELAVGDILLVCDVGGGTTDFTLIEVNEEDGALTLERRAVGNHLLVGGDNMDLALAHQAAAQFAKKGTQLDAWQSVSLWHACRNAKETIFAAEGPDTHPVTVLGRGSKLIGGTVSIDMDRKKSASLLLDGFFPKCDITEKPQATATSGFQEIGLPFEADTAVTRHLAAFLSAQGDGEAVQPTRLLFNGGVFKAAELRKRLQQTIAGWSEVKPKLLDGEHDLDYAVARGAAYYARAKQGRGIRIRGGTSHAYYVGIETSGPAIPGVPRPLRALCVAALGMEEGTEVDVPSAEIGLVVGQPAHFRFFSSATRRDDQPGNVIASWTTDEITETDPLEATLPASAETDEGYVPVKFHAKITELGMFELWGVSTTNDGRWKLEFNVRAN